MIRDGKISGKKKGNKFSLNPTKVKKELAMRKDPARDAQRKFNKEQKGKGAKKASSERIEKDEDEDDGEVYKINQQLAKTKIVTATIKAKKAELDLKEAQGKVIDVQRVIEINSKIDGVFRGKVLAITNKTMPLVLPYLKNKKIQGKVIKILDDISNDILKELFEMRETEKLFKDQFMAMFCFKCKKNTKTVLIGVIVRCMYCNWMTAVYKDYTNKKHVEKK